MDISFLRLVKNNFESAKQVDDIYIDGTRLKPLIQILPNTPKETFLQISNCESDIAFAGFIKVELIDCYENSLQNITSIFYFNEFTNTVTGIKQISYEFGNIITDYGQKRIFLKLTNLVSNDIWYSNAFLITNYRKEKTTKIWYKNENYFEGVPYDIQPYFQSVRLACFKFDNNYKQKRSEYIQLSGNEISLRIINTYLSKYKFDWCNFFVSDRLMRVFNHDEIYIDNYKVSNKPEITKGDRIDTSNFFELSFEANPTENYLNIGYQIYQPLQVISQVLPSASVNTSTTGLFSLTFNKNISLVSGITAKLYENGTLVSTITPTASTNVLSLDFSTYTFIDATYSIVINQNLIYHQLENWGGYGFGEWQFSIAQTLTINNVTNIGTKTFSLDYSSSGTPSSLHYQISYDGLTWLTPILLGSVTNPLTINTIALTDDFYVRIFEISGAYSNIYQYVKSSCVIPTLTSVVKNSGGTLTYNWNTNGFNYTSGGVAVLSYSIDGGTTWVTNAEDPTTGTFTINSTGLTTGMAILYKIVFTGGGCNMMQTNIISTTY